MAKKLKQQYKRDAEKFTGSPVKKPSQAPAA
ncbi:hypothetical protein M2404_000664 [Rheinheimera pacifica]|nr:hypothetical protein [Rheinheimera pacifica]